MSFGSRSGLLSGLSQAQLYHISATAGVNMSFSQWVGQEQFSAAAAQAFYAGTGRSLPCGSGGVLIIDVAASLSLPPGVVPGQAIRMSFSMEEANFVNHTREDVENPQLQIIALSRTRAAPRSSRPGASRAPTRPPTPRLQSTKLMSLALW